MINQNFIYLGLAILIFGNIHYIIETIKGKVKPNKVTYFLWALIPLITLAAQIKQGVGLQVLFTFMAVFFPLLIFIFSFFNKKSYWQIKKGDLICGVLSIIGLILWRMTTIANLAIMFSIAADFLAGWPTIVKAYYYPETEHYSGYFSSAIFALITLLTIKEWNFQTYSFSLYVFIAASLITILVIFNVKKLLKRWKS